MVTQSTLFPAVKPGTKPAALSRPKKRRKPAIDPKSISKREAARKAPFHFATPLREATVRGGVAQVCLISAGPGNAADRHFYPAETLQAAVDAGVFEAAQSYFDHPTSIEERVQPERSVLKLAGYFSNVRMGQVADENALERAAIIADFHPQSGNERVLELMRTAVDYAKVNPTRSYIGFSINAAGKSSTAEINGQTYNRVDHISEVISVDIVTRAGARGKLISFQEAARMARSKPSGNSRRVPLTKDFLTEAAAIRTAIKAGDVDVARTKFAEALGISKESLAKELGDANLDPKTIAMLLDKVSDLGIKSAFGMDPDDDATQDEDEDDSDDATSEDDGEMEDDDTEDDASEDDASEDDATEDDVESMSAADAKKALKMARRESAKTKTKLAKALREANAARRAKADAENELHKQLLERAAHKTFDELTIPATARPALLRKVRENANLDSKLAVQRYIRDEWALIKSALGGDGYGAIVRESGRRISAPSWKKGA